MPADAAPTATGDPTPRSAERGAHQKSAPASDRAFDYVTVGHVTIDVLGDPPADAAPDLAAKRPAAASPSPLDPAAGPRQPGGSAFYSALQAARLGLRTLIVTSGVPAELEALLEPYRAELQLRVLPAAHTTTLRTWSAGAARHQRLLAWAGPIAAQALALDTAILHLAPVARETPRAWLGHADFVALTPQGLAREWDVQGDITLTPVRSESLPEHCDAIALSAAERPSCEPLIAQATRDGAVVAVTAGPQPTVLQLPHGPPAHVPVPAIAGPRDDLGAGDVFAAAFFIALHEGLPPAHAAAFGNAAAAARVAAIGPRAIGDRRAVEGRLRQAPAPAPPR